MVCTIPRAPSRLSKSFMRIKRTSERLKRREKRRRLLVKEGTLKKWQSKGAGLLSGTGKESKCLTHFYNGVLLIRVFVLVLCRKFDSKQKNRQVGKDAVVCVEWL